MTDIYGTTTFQWKAEYLMRARLWIIPLLLIQLILIGCVTVEKSSQKTKIDDKNNWDLLQKQYGEYAQEVRPYHERWANSCYRAKKKDECENAKIEYQSVLGAVLAKSSRASVNANMINKCLEHGLGQSFGPKAFKYANEYDLRGVVNDSGHYLLLEPWFQYRDSNNQIKIQCQLKDRGEGILRVAQSKKIDKRSIEPKKTHAVNSWTNMDSRVIKDAGIIIGLGEFCKLEVEGSLLPQAALYIGIHTSSDKMAKKAGDTLKQGIEKGKYALVGKGRPSPCQPISLLVDKKYSDLYSANLARKKIVMND